MNAIESAMVIVDDHYELMFEALDAYFDEADIPIDVRVAIVYDATDSILSDAYADWRYEKYHG